jgi:glycosyltransferase involved in cell wall biosynthesis
LIEYGGDHTLNNTNSYFYLSKYPFLTEEYAFKVARIEPENNIHMVLESFSKIKKKLVIIGNWNKSEYGSQLKIKYQEYDNIKIMDPIYDQEELDVLRKNCWVYIHGHSAGGTNPSLVEAMCLRLPVVSFDVSYNRATTEDKASYFNSSNELISLVSNMDKISLLKNAASMWQIAKERYQWAVIANKYKNLIYSFDFNYEKQNIEAQISLINKKNLQERGLAHLSSPKYYYQND